MADDAQKPPTPPEPAAAKPAGETPAAKPAPKPAAAAAPKPAAAAHSGGDHVPKAAAPTGPTDPPPPADAQIPAPIASLQQAIPDGVTGLSLYLGDWTVMVPAAKLLEVAGHLRDAPDSRFGEDRLTHAEFFDGVFLAADGDLRRVESFEFVHLLLLGTKKRACREAGAPHWKSFPR